MPVIVLGLILVALKLTGIIVCSWFVALSPFLLELFAFAVLFTAAAVGMLNQKRKTPL